MVVCNQSWWHTAGDVTLFWHGVKELLRNIKGPNLSECHVSVWSGMIVLSVSGGHGAQKQQSMTRYIKQVDLFSGPEQGKNLGVFQRRIALKGEKVIPDSHVYISCKKMVPKGTWKVPRIVFACCSPGSRVDSRQFTRQPCKYHCFRPAGIS